MIELVRSRAICWGRGCIPLRAFRRQWTGPRKNRSDREFRCRRGVLWRGPWTLLGSSTRPAARHPRLLLFRLMWLGQVPAPKVTQNPCGQAKDDIGSNKFVSWVLKYIRAGGERTERSWPGATMDGTSRKLLCFRCS